MTSYVIADFDTEDGLDLLKEAAESLVYILVAFILTPFTIFLGIGLFNSNRLLAQPIHLG